MPLAAPTPVPTMTAVGVARPREHGHAMARTCDVNFKVQWSTYSMIHIDKIKFILTVKAILNANCHVTSWLLNPILSMSLTGRRSLWV